MDTLFETWQYRYVACLAASFSYLYFLFVTIHSTGLYNEASDEIDETERDRKWDRFWFENIILHFFFGMFVLCFLLSVCVPGHTPTDIMNARRARERRTGRKEKYKNIWLRKELTKAFTVEQKGSSDAREVRFCKHCKTFKPDRTHHDRQLGKCVLKMDHYCPWLHNTLGHNNLKYFYLTLMYGSASLLCWVILMTSRFVRTWSGMEYMQRDFGILFGYFFAVLLFGPVVWFFVFHTQLMLTAYTTIEYCELKDNQNKLNSNHYQTSPFDQGAYANVCEMLGPIPLLWLVPTRVCMRDDGDMWFYADDIDRSRVDMNHKLTKLKMKEIENVDVNKLLEKETS